MLKNHFHLLIQTRNLEELAPIVTEYHRIRDTTINPESEEQILQYLSAQISHFFNSYSQSINKRHQRTGSLWEHPYRRIAVTDERYFAQLIYYIHSNPVKHGFTTDFKMYPHSSYPTFTTPKPTKLERESVLEWFGGETAFKNYHESELSDLEDAFQRKSSHL
jgi:REP element-mobilizing transposase RayT